MLDQQVVDLANNRVSLEIADQNTRIEEDISRNKSEMVMRGFLQSGATIQRITSLCSDATKDRAQIGWQTLSRFLTTSEVPYYDGLAEELKRIVAAYLPASLDDLKGYVKQELQILGSAGLSSEMQQRVEDTRVAALAKINGEIDLFVIALREREKMSEALSRNASVMELNISKGSVFIAMPMFPEDSQLDDVHDAIKDVAISLGLSAKRVDDDETNERITDRVIDSLRTAEFVVADLTHNRPNVYYEAGYAHACSKIPIYIARQGTKIEFDLKDYPVIFFENLRQLKADLTKRLDGLSASRTEKTTRVQRTSHSKLPLLSDTAKQLLIEASQDSSGEIINIHSVERITIQTNGKEFVEQGNHESAALWKEAINELCNRGLLEVQSRDSSKITRKGYEVADLLCQESA